MHKNINCPNCSSSIPAKNINLQKELAKCENCDIIVQLDDSYNKFKPQRKEEIFVIPKGIDVLKMFGELNIDVSWRHATSFFLVFFTLLWNAMVLPFAIISIYSGEYFFLLFLSLHILVGIGLILWTLASLFNTTYITVDYDVIKIEHKPFKLWFKESIVYVNTIQQLFVKKYPNGSTNGNPNYAYKVVLLLKNNDEVELVKNIAKPVQARFIEQEIEKFTGIKDTYVEGEF